MTTARRESILTAIATRASASRAPFPILPTTPPYTLLVDGQETVGGVDYDDTLISMAIGVHRAAKAASDSSHAADASALLAALITAVLGSDRTLNGLCDDIRYDSGSTEYPSDSAIIAATATFIIDYRHIGGSPY